MRAVTVTAPVEKRCPHKDEQDTGSVTLTFHVREDAPELHRLAADLRTWQDKPCSHEDFTAAVLDMWAAEGCVAVRTTWTTAGMQVTVDVPV